MEGARIQCERMRKTETNDDKMVSEPMVPGFLGPKGDHCLASARSSQSFLSTRNQYIILVP